MVPINIKLDEGVEVPKYAHSGDSGFDLISTETVEFLSRETKLIGTGIYVEIPWGFELQVRPRSGLSYKSGFRVANSPGTIDSTYRGEIKVILQNTSQVRATIHKGDRIAQAVLTPVYTASFNVVDSLNETKRGENGFGSTGYAT